MKLPRWTVWPALGVLAVFLVPAVPVKREVATADAWPRVVVFGVDGLDPDVLAEVIAQHPKLTPNWQRLVATSGIGRLGTSTPPQSPVAWSNFITGLNPGGHGVYDFLHRDLVTRMPVSSITKSEPGSLISLWNGWQLPMGGDEAPNRTGQAFWTRLAEKGVPADIWRMPANFPVEPADGVSFSGMMTPAVDSAYGRYTLYTTNAAGGVLGKDGNIVPVRESQGRIDTALSGPPNPFKVGEPHQTTALTMYVDRQAQAVAIELGAERLVVRLGEWSEFVPTTFSLLPLGLSDVSGIVRFHVKSLDPHVEIYASPINIDPRAPIAPVSAPVEASALVADAIGLYYTQGMPEDVSTVKDGAFSDREFLAQADVVHDEGVRLMDHALARWKANARGGFLFFYTSGVDLCGHMLWRHHDAGHPHHDAEFARTSTEDWSHRPGSTWKEVVTDLYLRMDPLVGRVLDAAGERDIVIVMSDHGFESYRRKFSLNTWLLEQGYLVLKDGYAKELPESDAQRSPVYLLDAVDWSKTRAYGLGFNGLYLNLQGRERDNPATPDSEAGIVQPGAEATQLLTELKTKLEALRDQDGTQVVLRADLATAVYDGPRVAEAPDVVVGYNALYGNSDEASSGRIPHEVLCDNLGGTFNGSHLMAPEVVEGTILANRRVRPGAHRLEDLTVEVLRRYGVAIPADLKGQPVLE